jgi:hypothetical protein
VNTWCSVHRIADCQSPLLHALGEELAVTPIDLCWGDTKEGWEETHPNFPLQWLEEWAHVGNYMLDVLPFILKAKRESGIGSLGIAFGNDTECLHRTYPFANHFPQPLLLLPGAPGEATQVPGTAAPSSS